MNTINILIANDQRLFSDCIQLLLLEKSPHIKVVAIASNGKEVLNHLEKIKIDIVLLGISIPDMNGLEITSFISSQYPDIKVIILSIHKQISYILKMLQSGAKGYLLKDIKIEGLIEAIEMVYNGGTYYSPEVAVNLIDKLFKDNMQATIPKNDLTKREIEIIKLVATGLRNKQIANSLFISQTTVKTHRQRIQNKLSLKNTIELVKYAYDHNLV